MWTSTTQILPDCKNKIAIVQLVMNSDKYVLSSVALIRSIQQRNKTPVDYVVFTNNVSEKALINLRLVGAIVIQVELIEFPVNANIWPRFQANYSWLASCFTKLYAFALTSYEKVLFLDSDMLCLSTFDSLFSVPTPAGCVVSRDKPGMHTGCRVPPSEMLLALAQGYGVSGACFMISPKIGDFQKLLARAAQRVAICGHYVEDATSITDCLSPQDKQSLPRITQPLNAGPDEQLITWFNFNRWINISRQFCCVPWLAHRFEHGEFPIRYVRAQGHERSLQISETVDFDGHYDRDERRRVALIHYVAEKPWAGIGKGELWPDCKLFFDGLEAWEQGKQYVTETFGDITQFKYKSQGEADQIYNNDYRRKFDNKK